MVYIEEEEDFPSERTEALEKALEGAKTWTAEERSAYCDNIELNPLFMTSSEEASSNPIAHALQNANYDEIDTPFALANESKQKGNDAFVKGVEWYPNSIKHYNESIGHALKGIEDKSTPKSQKKELRKLISVCESNLAAIYLYRKKYITVIECCQKALELWPDNTKACYRAAKACIALGRATNALSFCEMGLLTEPDNKSLHDLISEASKIVSIQEKREERVRLEKEKRELNLQGIRQACKVRGITVGPPVYGSLRRNEADPYIDADDKSIHWPVVILYPQYHQSDFLEDVTELATFEDLISHMFPKGSPPPAWDVRGEYVDGNIEVFYKSNPCKPVAIEEAWTTKANEMEPEESWLTTRLIKLPQEAPILFPISQPDYIVADIPVFYFIARSSDMYADLKKKSGGDFVSLRIPDAMKE